MKKIWLLTACCSLLLAEDPSLEEEIVIPASKPLEETSSELIVNTPVLPDVQPSSTILMTQQDVVVSTDSPSIDRPPVLQSPVMTELSPPAATQQLELNPEEEIAAIVKEEKEVADELKSVGIIIDMGQVFAGSPMIYSVLLILSMASVGIWAYMLLNLRRSELLPPSALDTLKNELQAGNYEVALDVCKKHPTLFMNMIATGIENRGQDALTRLELMKAEGKRLSASYWQKISLLNDIAILAPMLGLLGTVLGMFYAFYDLNRSAESISALFDGLGISVGTTVGGLVVAILALLFHAMTKYRLMKQLTLVENEAQSVAQSLQRKDPS